MATKNRNGSVVRKKGGQIGLIAVTPAADAPIQLKDDGDLFDRVARVLEQARANAVRAVDRNMVIAYWLIGREIIQEVQRGEARADYGRRVVKALAEQLVKRYGRGFSETNLRYFRLFYQAYADRSPGIRPDVARTADASKKQVSKDLETAIADGRSIRGFSPMLNWSHYRTLSGVQNRAERNFYEIEAERCGWSQPTLERQIHTSLFARLLKSRDKVGVLELASKGQELRNPIDAIKHPYVLDFLDIPEAKQLHESGLEAAIIESLQPFLLELGKGFAFVARQMRIATESQHFYIDLVFYNYLLKCFLLVDLKMGRLTHQDVGQMDMYVRMFDELRRGEDDNPTIGLILCAERDEVVARYSVLKESRQLFASKYMLYLPTVEELQKELARESGLLGSGRSKRPKRPK